MVKVWEGLWEVLGSSSNDEKNLTIYIYIFEEVAFYVSSSGQSSFLSLASF